MSEKPVEPAVSLKAARKLFDTHPCRDTLMRWRKQGVLVGGRRVKLAVRKEGGRLVVDLAAVEAFKAATNQAVRSKNSNKKRK